MNNTPLTAALSTEDTEINALSGSWLPGSRPAPGKQTAKGAGHLVALVGHFLGPGRYASTNSLGRMGSILGWNTGATRDNVA